MRAILLAVSLAIGLFGCAGTKERVKLETAVAKITKAIDAGVAAGYIKATDADAYRIEVTKGFTQLDQVQRKIEAAKAAYQSTP